MDTVNVPEAPPMFIVVPAPAKFTVVAVVLAKLNVVWLVEIVPPFAAIVPPKVAVPLPKVTAPLLVVCTERVLAPMSQVEAAAPVRFSAPAEVSARVPDVVVETVRFPEVESMLLVPAPLSEIAAEVPAFDTERPTAVWDWTMETAVAAVPDVPLTVKPTTLLAVGVTVF